MSCIKHMDEAKLEVDEMWQSLKLKRARDIYYIQNKVNSRGQRWIVWWEKLFGEDYYAYTIRQKRKASEGRDTRK